MGMTLITIACLAFALLVFVPSLVLAVEVWASKLKGKGPQRRFDPDCRIAVLMPAHNEELVIVPTLEAVQRALPPGARLLVVADNCTDATAQLARGVGAEVVERHDTSLRGKCYALTFGVQHLATWRPDVVVIVDADCEPKADAILKIASLAHGEQRPVQALYLLDEPEGANSDYLRLSVIAWRMRNYARLMGLYKLGLPSLLVGCGMAIPWRVIETVRFDTGHLTDDYLYGLDCAEAGAAAYFCPDALILSSFPANPKAQATQRTRWETGHVDISLRIAPRFILKAIRNRNVDLLVLALDMLVPPLAFLGLWAVLSFAVSLVLAVAAGYIAPLVFSTSAIGLLAFSLLYPREMIIKDTMSIADLLLAPIYAAGKIMLYIRIMMGRKIEWIRTGRD